MTRGTMRLMAELPRALGPYRILRELGRGGMGVVYLAERGGVQVALKVLLRPDPAGLLRFRREAELATRVGGEGVVRCLEFGVADEHPYFAMEFCPGDSLQARLRQGAFAPREAARLIADLARTLERVHAHGVVHRDLKPANVLLPPGEPPRLTDFGVARQESAERLTQTGELLGTPRYMAPEQILDGKRVDARTDVYALGTILYCCLTGQPPFHTKPGVSVVNLFQEILAGNPQPPRQLDGSIPPALERICLAAMDVDPAARTPSAAALADALEGFLSSSRAAPRSSRLPLLLVGGAALAGLVVLGGWWATRAPDPLPAEVTQAAPPPPAKTTPPPQPAPPVVPPPTARQLLTTAQRPGARPLSDLLRLLDRARLLAKTDPDLRDAIQVERVDLYHRRGRQREALAAAEPLPRGELARLLVRNLQAQATLRLRNRERAFDMFEELARDDPNGHVGLVARAQVDWLRRRKARTELVSRALALAPTYFEARLRQAYGALLFEKDVPKAKRLLRPLLERRPDHLRLRWFLVSIRKREAGTAAALEVLNGIVRDTGPNPDLGALALRATFNSTRPALAQQDLQRVLRANPHDAEALIFLGFLAHQAGQHERRDQLWRQCLLHNELGFKLTLRSIKVNTRIQMMKRTLRALRVERTFRAEHDPEPLLTGVPKAASPHLATAVRNAMAGRPWEAIATPLAAAVRAAPESPAVALMRVRLLVGRDRPEGLRVCRKAQQDTTPLRQRLLRELEATWLWRASRPLESFPIWSELAKGNDAVAFRARAAQCFLGAKPGGYRAALQWVERATRQAPHSLRTLSLQCRVLFSVRRAGLAIEAADRGLGRYGRLDARLLSLRAMAFMHLARKLPGAEPMIQAEFEAAFRLSPSFCHRLGPIGLLALTKQPKERAWIEALLAAARQQEPSNSLVRLWSGHAALGKGAPAREVLRWWGRAKALEPRLTNSGTWRRLFLRRYPSERAALEQVFPARGKD